MFSNFLSRYSGSPENQESVTSWFSRLRAPGHPAAAAELEVPSPVIPKIPELSDFSFNSSLVAPDHVVAVENYKEALDALRAPEVNAVYLPSRLRPFKNDLAAAFEHKFPGKLETYLPVT